MPSGVMNVDVLERVEAGVESGDDRGRAVHVAGGPQPEPVRLVDDRLQVGRRSNWASHGSEPGVMLPPLTITLTSGSPLRPGR